MTFEQNVNAILNCNFAGFTDEIIDCATTRICELNAEEIARLKAENNRLTSELEHIYELYNTLLADKKAPGVLFICDKQKDCNKSPTCSCSWGLKGCSHTFDVTRALNFKKDINGNYVEASGDCPFGDCKETCSDYRINRCDLCKFEDKGAEK